MTAECGFCCQDVPDSAPVIEGMQFCSVPCKQGWLSLFGPKSAPEPPRVALYDDDAAAELVLPLG